MVLIASSKQNKILLAALGVVLFFAVGIAIPKLTVHDMVPAEVDRSCVEQVLNKPIKKLSWEWIVRVTGQTQVMSADASHGDVKFYTLFRIPLDLNIAINCLLVAPTITEGTNVDGLGQFRDSKVTDSKKSFASNKYGISFTYPSNYFVFDTRSANADGENYAISIMPDSHALRQALANEHNEPGMIPRISIFFYHSDSNASLEDIAREKIVHANGEGAPIPTFNKTTVGDISAIRYTDASGLYSRDTVLLKHGDWMVQISADDATYFKTDLDSILSSITFY